MDTLAPPKKKRGPVPKPNMVSTRFYVHEDLKEWAKYQPEGLSELLRKLLEAERQRRTAPPSIPPSPAPPPIVDEALQAMLTRHAKRVAS